jgi:hypothetical protein
MIRIPLVIGDSLAVIRDPKIQPLILIFLSHNLRETSNNLHHLETRLMFKQDMFQNLTPI